MDKDVATFGGAELYYSRGDASDPVYIKDLWTDPPQRGQGHAKALMKTVIEQADRDGQTLKLLAGDQGGMGFDNLVRFYKSLGFVEVGEIVNPGPHQFVEMVRQPKAAAQVVVEQPCATRSGSSALDD
jgi:GNAT superfamily N-acetyltransferase